MYYTIYEEQFLPTKYAVMHRTALWRSGSTAAVCSKCSSFCLAAWGVYLSCYGSLIGLEIKTENVYFRDIYSIIRCSKSFHESCFMGTWQVSAAVYVFSSPLVHGDIQAAASSRIEPARSKIQVGAFLSYQFFKENHGLHITFGTFRGRSMNVSKMHANLRDSVHARSGTKNIEVSPASRILGPKEIKIRGVCAIPGPIWICGCHTWTSPSDISALVTWSECHITILFDTVWYWLILFVFLSVFLKVGVNIHLCASFAECIDLRGRGMFEVSSRFSRKFFIMKVDSGSLP